MAVRTIPVVPKFMESCHETLSKALIEIGRIKMTELQRCCRAPRTLLIFCHQLFGMAVKVH